MSMNTYRPFLRGGMILAAICILHLTTAAQNAGDALFSGIQIHTVHLRFSIPDWYDSLAFYYDEGDEQYIPVQLEANGTIYNNIGVRFKGNSSYSYPGTKKSLRLEFDAFGGDERWDGEKDIHLNNMWGDPTFMREKLHTDFCRSAGIHAPRANYARVYINDEYWGFYSMVEHVDKRFTKTHYGDNNGDMFKAVDAFGGGGSSQKFSDFRWRGATESLYYDYYEMKTDGSTTAWPKLVALIDVINNQSDAASLEATMNIASFEQAVAADILLGNLDSYIGGGRNFYLYFNPKTSKAEWIVWDTGLSFGAYSIGTSRVETMSVTYVNFPSSRPLASRMYNGTTFHSDYLHTLCRLVNEHFIPERMNAHIDSIAIIIRSSINEDSRKMYTMTQFETNISTDINAQGGGGTRKPGLKSYITQRRASVLSQLDALGISCVLAADPVPIAPATFTLSQNYPNPFTGQTSLSYELATSAHVTIDLTSMVGTHVATLVDAPHAAGRYTLPVRAAALAPGTWLCTMRVGDQTATRKLIVIP